MNYRVACPNCQTRLPRWQFFTSPSIYYRCAKCDTRFRVTALGWVVALAVIVIQFGWLLLYRRHHISSRAGIALLAVTFALAVWLLPYLSPVRLGSSAASSEDTKK